MKRSTDHSIFQSLPVAALVEDCSSLKRLYQKLQRSKEGNVLAQLRGNPALVKQAFCGISILAANKKALELYGVKRPAEILDRFRRSMSRKNLKTLLEEFQALMDRNADYQGLLELRTPAGRACEVLVKFAILPGHEKTLNRVVVTLEDVTEQKQAERHLRKMAQLDGLTGLLNHKAVKERLDQELTRAKRHKLDLSCLMIDVDHFKYVNDRFGHQKGDQMIRHMARIIRENVRRSDIIGRYGGDEFLVILPETKPQNSVIVALRIQKYFQLAMTKYLRQDQIKNALSIGISGYPDKEIETAKDMIAMADKIMYKAKVSGGDRILHPRMISQRPVAA